HVQIDDGIICEAFALARRPQNFRVTSEKLGSRLRFGRIFIEEKAGRLAVVFQPLGADHFGKTQSRTVRIAKLAESEIRIPRKRSAEHVVLRFEIPDLNSFDLHAPSS